MKSESERKITIVRYKVDVQRTLGYPYKSSRYLGSLETSVFLEEERKSFMSGLAVVNTRGTISFFGAPPNQVYHGYGDLESVSSSVFDRTQTSVYIIFHDLYSGRVWLYHDEIVQIKKGVRN